MQEIVIEQSLEKKFFNRIYGWMSLALVTTGLTSLYISSSKSLLYFFYKNPFLLFGLFILQLFAVGKLSSSINKMTYNAAIGIFIGYSILTGITLSGLMIIYTGASLFNAFLITAATFGFMTIYGYTTNKDLTDLGRVAFMGLIGVIIASLVNFLFRSPLIYWIINYVGVLVFIALTAYDTQKLKKLYATIEYDEEATQKYAILGALTLYLDFINLFIFILRITGRRR